MNLFGLEIKPSNNKYVKKEDCNRNMDAMSKQIDDLSTHIDSRFDDIKALIKSGDRVKQ